MAITTRRDVPPTTRTYHTARLHTALLPCLLGRAALRLDDSTHGRTVCVFPAYHVYLQHTCLPLPPLRHFLRSRGAPTGATLSMC